MNHLEEEMSDVGTKMRQHLEMTPLDLKFISDLPSALIITNVPAIVFINHQEKKNFAALFHDLDEDVRFEYFSSFKRIRATFSSPQAATGARLYCDNLTFLGQTLKTYFAQNVDTSLSDFAIQTDDNQLLRPPQIEKLFLISPPTSPPVGWVQMHEMQPVVCNMELMSRLAAFAINDTVFESVLSTPPSQVHPGSDGHPAIVVHPCENEDENCPESTPHPTARGQIQHTPRPSLRT